MKQPLFPRISMIFKYPKGLDPMIGKAVIQSFSEWTEYLYPLIIAACPVYKSPDPRRTPGFVRSHIKIMIKRSRFGPYKAIGVPGGSVKMTPAYHALAAIYAMEGASGRGLSKPLIITAKNKKVLAFPMPRKQIRGEPGRGWKEPGGHRRRGPRTWVYTPTVKQTKWAPPNKFVTRTVEENRQVLFYRLRANLVKYKTKGRREKIVIS